MNRSGFLKRASPSGMGIRVADGDKSELHKHGGTGCTLFDNAGRTLS